MCCFYLKMVLQFCDYVSLNVTVSQSKNWISIFRCRLSVLWKIFLSQVLQDWNFWWIWWKILLFREICNTWIHFTKSGIWLFKGWSEYPNCNQLTVKNRLMIGGFWILILNFNINRVLCNLFCQSKQSPTIILNILFASTLLHEQCWHCEQQVISSHFGKVSAFPAFFPLEMNKNHLY